MTNDVTNEGAPSGAQPPQTRDPLPQGDGNAAVPGAAPAAAGFSAEQQAAVDRIVAERLKRAADKWQADQDARAAAAAEKAKADADAAEAERQAKQGEWEALARKHETTAKEAKAQAADLTARLERADGVIAGLVESRKAGLPEALLKALEGRDIYDQLQLVDAFQSALPAPATTPAGATSGRQPALPTPATQGPQTMTSEERRQRAARIW